MYLILPKIVLRKYKDDQYDEIFMVVIADSEFMRIFNMCRNK